MPFANIFTHKNEVLSNLIYFVLLSNQMSAPRPRVNPDEYNEQAQERRMKVVLKMLEKTEKLNEKEYEAHLQAKQVEKKNEKIQKEKRDEVRIERG